ncbi:penicillin-binding transpeptidase domain-containing protein [Mollicutes bacterium LVI A0039]|nr:penicillin-binding transpeptidase domain-containing protein [Mollicutes bacterium LVI A0039]
MATSDKRNPSNKQSTSRSKPNSASTKKPNAGKSPSKTSKSKQGVKASTKKAATKAPAKKRSTQPSKTKTATTKQPAKHSTDKVKAVRKTPNVKKGSSTKRKLTNLEVRNRSQGRKVKSKLKVVRPQKKVHEPLIYDEAKYLKSLKKRGRKNLLIITMVFIFLFLISLLFVIRLEVTHLKHGNNLDDYAEENYTETTNIKSKRGTIYDTNGEALAINLEVYNLIAVTSRDFECNVNDEYVNCALTDTQTASEQMAKALGYDAEGQAYIKETLDYGISDNKYQVTFGTYGMNITLSQKKALEALEYPWLQFEPQELRFYPYGDFASYIIGYTTKDENGEINGALGVESALDGHLKGQDGIETSSFDNYGIELTDAQKSAIPKIDGTDVQLTLDSVIQTYLESSMEKALSAPEVQGIQYEGLLTIVMDAKTGDILAGQSYPTFDPNVREIENYTNFFTDYCFEPGSTFKTATVAAADEAGVWSDSAANNTGSRSASTWGGATIKDWNYGAGWGVLNWNEGLYMSSNTIMTYIMDQIPQTFWYDFVTNKLLIGTPVSTQFFETPSCVFDPQYDLDYAITSFGQGMTVNTLQMLRMYSALVGDGKMVTPHIVETIKDSETGEVIYTDEDLEVIENVVSKETSQHVREALEGVVTYNNGTIIGTGSNYLGGEYNIGVKTGTAEMAGSNGKYESNKYLYSAMTAAPIEDPQLLIYTLVINPTGTAISAQAFPQYVNEVYDNSLSYLNSENRKVDLDASSNMYTVGSFVGKDISEAPDKGTIKIGSGPVVSQYPKAGQETANHQRVVLFGTENVKFPNLTGYTYNETIAVCNELKVTCEFTNTGTRVKEVTNESENKYKIKME